MGFRTMKKWLAECQGCGFEVWMPDCTRDEFVRELRSEGWSYCSETRRVVCPACRAAKQLKSREGAAHAVA